MKSMRELMEAVVAEGKGKGGGNIFQDDKHSGQPGGDEVVTMDKVVAMVARHLGWTRAEGAKSHPYLHDIQFLASKVYPRVFTKSNVQFALYGIAMGKGKGKDGGSGIYIVVAAKRRSASWNTRGEDATGRDPHSVTYFRIPIIEGNEVEDQLYAQKVKTFTQQYKRANANSDAAPEVNIVG